MTKLELLNVFLNDRLTAAADDIFRAVKDAVAEYQNEILRSKEENERLKRLLNAAVQRLLLLQPEPHSLQLPEDNRPCEPEWTSGPELQSQIKEEPNSRSIQTDPEEDLVGGNCRQSIPPERSYLSPPVSKRQGISPAPLTTPKIKVESEEEEVDRGHEPGNSLASSISVQPKHKAALMDFHTSTIHSERVEKTDSQSRPERQQARVSACSNAKQSTHILQSKNVRGLRLPPPRSSHPGQNMQKWHSCKECGKAYSFACQLEVHMRWHTKEKPYSCAVCKKSFTTASMLKRHHRIHTGEKPFRCHVCGKCFNQSAHLNTHFRRHTREGVCWSRAMHAK